VSRILVAAIIAVIVLVVIVGSLVEMQQPPSRGRGVVTVEVTYAGRWSGFYLDGSDYVSWNGNGTRDTTLMSPAGTSMWVIVAEAQKRDNSSEMLTVSILLPNGTVANSANTSAAYGAVQASCEFND